MDGLWIIFLEIDTLTLPFYERTVENLIEDRSLLAKKGFVNLEFLLDVAGANCDLDYIVPKAPAFALVRQRHCTEARTY